MYHQTPPGGKKCSSSSSSNSHRGTATASSVGVGVDQPQQVKLLADVGYIADRLRNLERCWELAELKDLHKRIVLLLASDECPPLNVVRAIRADQLRPVQAELHGRTQLQQEVEQAAVEARQADKVKRARWRQEVDCSAALSADDESAQAKLAQLEDFLVAFYRSYREVKAQGTSRVRASAPRKSKKVRERKVFPFLPSSSSESTSPTAATPSSSSSPTTSNKCHQQPNKPNQPPADEQQQQQQSSQADRTMNQDREPEDPNVASSEQQQAKQPTNPSDNPSDAKQPEPTTSSNNSNTSTKDDDEDEDVTTNTATTTTTTTEQQLVTVVSGNAIQDEKRPSLDAPSSSPLTSAATKSRCPHIPSGDSTEPDEEEDDEDDDDNSGGGTAGGGDFCNDELGEGERNKLRKRISELANNFASAKQFQQMCDNIDAINDAELRALIRELKRKIEFAERMNWMCLSSRPRGPPHRKTSLPKHTDVKKRFLEVADTTLPDEVKAALRLPAFDSYEWEDWDVIHLMQTMFVELNLLDKFQIPRETLREWLYEVYKHYNDVPFHNYRHCFCVAQMMYAITWHTNLIQRLGELEVLILLVSCICHDLDHPGYNNIYQINARTELALRYNDISPLENHHCSIAFRLLEHPECNIFRNMDKELYKDVREGIIRCILATDMARHNEILTQFQEATPVFDYNNKVHTNLLCMVLIKVADISNEARPMDVAEPWLDRLLQEFFAQSAAEKSEGLPVTPFMDPDKVSKPGSQVRFIGLVLLPLFEALGELLPELTDLIITPVRVALDYYKKLNDAANRQRRSIAEAEQSSENASTVTTGTAGTGTAGGSSCGGGGGAGGTTTGISGSIGGGTGGGLSNSSTTTTGSPQLPRSQSGISVKSRPELHDLPEGSESGDSETATEVDVAEKTSKFKVDTESSHRKQSHPNSQSSRKGSREKRPSMIGEYYQTA